MKQISLLLTFFSCLPFLAEDLETRQPYTIVSESFDASLAEGRSRVSGTVYYGFGKEEALIGASVYLDEKNGCLSDQEGKFMLEIPQTTELLLVRYLQDVIRLDKLQLKSQHHYRIEVFFPPMQDVLFKPVIYAYSERPLDAVFKLEVKGELSFTYPQIQNGQWQVRTGENGMLCDRKGQSYPYLFWEGESAAPLRFSVKNDIPEGHFVERDSLLSFLEASLDRMGFNAREKTDFITFWAPRMVKHSQVFVQFLVDEDYDAIASLDVSPKPDQVRRVYLLYKGISNNFEYNPQSFESFERSGFTVLEWGGSELKSDEL